MDYVPNRLLAQRPFLSQAPSYARRITNAIRRTRGNVWRRKFKSFLDPIRNHEPYGTRRMRRFSSCGRHSAQASKARGFDCGLFKVRATEKAFGKFKFACHR